MTRIFILILTFIPIVSFSQTIDSVAIKQTDSLFKVAQELIKQKEFEKAQEIISVAENIAIDKMGKESVAFGTCCHIKARIFKGIGLLKESEMWFEQALLIREKKLGKDHPDYASTNFHLAHLTYQMGNYFKSEKYFIQLKDLDGKAYGKKSKEYLSTIHSLAFLYRLIEQCEKSEALYLETKSIMEELIDVEGLEFADMLNGFANLYKDMGNFENAEKYYLQSKNIREKKLGKDHPTYGESLLNLGVLYVSIENFQKAEELCLETIRITEKTLGKENQIYALQIGSLAIVYSMLGQSEKAESLSLESIGIYEKVLGKEHIAYSAAINNLATYYMVKKQFDKAKPLLIESLAIKEKLLGKENPIFSTSLSNLALFYKETGEYDKSDSLLLESKSLRERILGKNHPLYASALKDLMELYLVMGEYKKSEPYITDLAVLNTNLITKALQYLSEKEISNYLNSIENGQSGALSFSQINKVTEGNITQTCYNNALFYKGFLLNVSNQIKRLALNNPNTVEKFNLLKSNERLLASKYSLPIANRDEVEILKIEADGNDLQKELARSVAGYGEVMQQVKWQEVQKKLKPGEAAIEIVKYKFLNKKWTDSTMYAALILTANSISPKFTLLSEERALDSIINTKSERKSDYVNALYTIADRGATELKSQKKSLFEILLKPLEKELDGINTIYLSPVGLLHRLNLDAIPITETETLADKYKIISLNSTRQLVVPTQLNVANNDAYLFGGIQFDPDSTLKRNEPLLASRSSISPSFENADVTSRGGTWNYLAGTEREVNNIEKIMLATGMSVKLKKGYKATEESFKKIGVNNTPSPRILHLATHGFFFPDPMTDSKINFEIGQNESVFKMSNHPMLRSGLIMTGGNAAWQGKLNPEGTEDGILTAYEISQMNLSNTELVVLSACETGLGDIKGNEGVYGLQRAFKIAGVKYLIMSLWQVPDKQTSLLMSTFYKKWLEDKMNIPDAFHASQKQMRESGLEPFYWAGFVLVE